MMAKSIALRAVISLLIGLLAAGLISEIGFYAQDPASRPPKTIELVIPLGAREMALKRESILPESMVFVVGDVLLVRNEDTVPHTFGPLYIPPGASASLELDQPENVSYTCSFQPSQLFGLDVIQPLTVGTRLEGILLAGAPMGILLAVYSLVIWPLKPKKLEDQQVADGI
jgi:hypothetical protein